jgi:hypothetical protein
MRRLESGQSVVLLSLAVVGLFLFAALAIDGGRLYAERRHAQNAADNAVFAAARALCFNQDIVPPGLAMANANGYDNDGTGDTVTINNPPLSGPYAGEADYVEVVIVSNFPSALIQLIRPGDLQVTVRAVGYCDYWTGTGEAALFAYSETCNNSMIIPGSNNTIIGGIHSNNDIQITGQFNLVQGIATYHTSIDAKPLNVTFDPSVNNPLQAPLIEPPLVYELADYADGGSRAAAATAVGEYVYVPGSIDMKWLEKNGFYDKATGVLRDGLYYATGNIKINGGDLTGNVSFVAEGTVDLSGPNQSFTAYIDNIMAFAGKTFSVDAVACNSAVITLSHSGNSYVGVFYAPGGQVNLSGQDITIRGGVLAYSIDLSGRSITVINEAIIIPPQPGTVEMTE